MEKVANLGQLGDVVKVRNGYARNFLIPKGKAKRATQVAIAEFEVRRAELEKTQADIVAGAQGQADKLNGLMVQVTRKAGIDGKLFGSVTNADIEDALRVQGVTVERAMIRMPQGPLKQVGDYPITIALHSDVVASIVVSVLGEPTS
jgi:large subunit ribosomal protein L9